MKINLTPQRREQSLEVVKLGNTLKLNGELFDFTPMSEGDTLPASAIASNWFFGTVDKIDGEIELTLFLPLPKNFSTEQAFPLPLVDVPDGPVTFPAPLPIAETESLAEVAQ
jgi:hypothetical protein